MTSTDDEWAATAARSGADTVFDWDDTTTHDEALRDVTALYLVPPALRLDYTENVLSFVDRAQANGVEHVTFLSAYGMQHAPDSVPLRAVELDLITRTGITHSIVRPAWFMQNFSESFFQPELTARRVISAPTGSGTDGRGSWRNRRGGRRRDRWSPSLSCRLSCAGAFVSRFRPRTRRRKHEERDEAESS